MQYGIRTVRVGADAHIGPAEQAVYTKVHGKFVLPNGTM